MFVNKFGYKLAQTLKTGLFSSVQLTPECCISNVVKVSYRFWAPLMGDGDENHDIITEIA